MRNIARSLIVYVALTTAAFAQFGVGIRNDTNTPEAHAASHEAGGTDEIDVTGLTGASTPPEGTAVLSTGEPAGALLQANGAGASNYTLTPSVTSVTASGAVQAASITDAAGTGAPSATFGLVLPDNAYISSSDTDDNALVYRFNNTTTGWASELGMIANGISSWHNNVQGWTFGASFFGPAVNGSKSIGSAQGAVDDLYLDDLQLQQSTDGEGRIHWEGAAGNDTVGVRISDETGAIFTAATGNSLSFLGPASPASGESVEMMRLTTAAAVITQGLNLNEATPEPVTLGASATSFAVGSSTLVELTGDGGGNPAVDTITGATEGRYVCLTVASLGGGITLVDTASPGADQIAMVGNAALTIDSTFCMLRGPTYWKEISRALN